jgi:hypothetical protein
VWQLLTLGISAIALKYWSNSIEKNIAQALILVELASEHGDNVQFSDLYLSCNAHLSARASTGLINVFEAPMNGGYLQFVDLNAEVSGCRVGISITESGHRFLKEEQEHVAPLRNDMRRAFYSG